MTNLRIDEYVGGIFSARAAGDGTASKESEFSVELTSGKSITKGKAYGIYQGSRGLLGIADCLNGAEGKGFTAKFSPYRPIARDIDGEGVSSFQQLRLLLLSSQKTVQISIDSKDLAGLKESGYRLCFAKKVAEGTFNVVWQSYTKFLSSNTFSWTPQYQLFAQNTFQSNIKVKAQTNIVDIGLGEQSTLDKYGVLSDPKTGGSSTSMTMINNYDSIHPGVNQISTGIDGQQISTPIYVASSPIVTGEAKLTPVESVLVWFEQNVETSTMFSDARSKAIEIDLTRTNTAARLYQGGQWTTP